MIGASIVAVAIVAASIAVAVYRGAGRESGNRIAAGGGDPASQVAGQATVVEQDLDDGPTSPAEGPARPSPGCAAATPMPAEPQTRTLSVGGATREYRLALPAGAEPTQPLPLVLDLHGLGLNRDQQSFMSGWDRIAAVQPIAVVQPQAVNGLWNLDATDANPDIAFMRAIVETVGRERCIDQSRVYADGISMGAILTSLVACKASDLVAAVGVVAGIQWKPECASAPPRPLVAIWGTKDCVLPFYGGLGPCLAVGPPGRIVPTAPLPPEKNMGFPPVEQVVEAWASHNGCSPLPDQPYAEHVTHRRFRQCPSGAVVDLYVVNGGGHAWPGNETFAKGDKGDNNGRGITTLEIDATATFWEFFQKYQLPA